MARDKLRQAICCNGLPLMHYEMALKGPVPLLPMDRAWQEGQERPFLLDTVWDVTTGVVDALVARADVDPARIAMTGVSLGGMITWLAAAADPRIAIAAPMIGVQVDSPAPCSIATRSLCIDDTCLATAIPVWSVSGTQAGKQTQQPELSKMVAKCLLIA